MEVLERLRRPVPESAIRTRPQGGNLIKFVPWYKIIELLDERAPGWEFKIKEVGNIAGKTFIRGSLTINGLTREQIGNEDDDLSGYGDPYSNSVAMLLRRLAVMFGLGRELYDGEAAATKASVEVDISIPIGATLTGIERKDTWSALLVKTDLGVLKYFFGKGKLSAAAILKKIGYSTDPGFPIDCKVSVAKGEKYYNITDFFPKD